HLGHVLALDPGLLDGGADRRGAEGGRGHTGELAEHGTDGGALGTDDDDVAHGVTPVEWGKSLGMIAPGAAPRQTAPATGGRATRAYRLRGARERAAGKGDGDVAREQGAVAPGSRCRGRAGAGRLWRRRRWYPDRSSAAGPATDATAPAAAPAAAGSAGGPAPGAGLQPSPELDQRRTGAQGRARRQRHPDRRDRQRRSPRPPPARDARGR